MSKLLLKLLNEDAKVPKKGSAMAAGYDIYSSENVTLEPNKGAWVSTGIAFTVPEGTYGRIAPRSGLSGKDIFINAGVVDRDYTGEVKVRVFNQSNKTVLFLKHTKIAQLIIEKIQETDLEIVSDLNPTERGENGFGSTG